MVDWREVYDWAGLRVCSMVRAEYDPARTEILDVGAGQGKYRRLLPEFEQMDACEVWEPYVVEHNLKAIYRQVFVRDVMDFTGDEAWHGRSYHLIILGDVLEHLTSRDARVLIKRVCQATHDVLVVVPYLYEQGPEHGNEHQRHLQDDLTPEIMTRRYPELRLIAVESRDDRPFKGLYRRRSRT